VTNPACASEAESPRIRAVPGMPDPTSPRSPEAARALMTRNLCDS
jgi:hypothetical protein